MKITLEQSGHKVVLQDDSVVDVCDVIDMIEKALWEAGYAKERVEGAFLVKAKQITGEWK